MHGMVTGDVLAKYDNLVLERLWTKQTSYSIDATHPLYGRAFLRFLLFQEWPELVANLGLRECVLFYNRYYWARRFANAYQAVHGPDAGLEQEVFKILDNAPEDVNWDILDSIDKGVGATPE